MTGHGAVRAGADSVDACCTQNLGLDRLAEQQEEGPHTRACAYMVAVIAGDQYTGGQTCDGPARVVLPLSHWAPLYGLRRMERTAALAPTGCCHTDGAMWEQVYCTLIRSYCTFIRSYATDGGAGLDYLHVLLSA